MTVQAKLADGTILEFPDGTPDEVVDRAAAEASSRYTPDPDSPGLLMDKTTGEKGIGTITKQTLGKTLKEAVVNEGPAVAGGIATGLAAAATGGVSIPAMAGYVALGAGGGEAIKQLGQRMSGSLGAPATSLEAAKRIGAAGAEEGAWELVGGLAMKGLQRFLKPFRSTMVEGAQEVVDSLKGKIKPVVLMPSEQTESRVLDVLNNIAEASLIGGNKIAEFRTSRAKAFEDLADNMIDQFGARTDPTDLGNLFVTAVERKKAMHGRVASILYNNVEESIERSGASTVSSNIIRRNLDYTYKATPEDLLSTGSTEWVRASDKSPIEAVGTVTYDNTTGKFISGSTARGAGGEELLPIDKSNRITPRNIVFHGRQKKMLNSQSRTTEGVGVHFSDDPSVSLQAATEGVRDEDVTDGFLHAIDISRKKFVELGEEFNDKPEWTLGAIKRKLRDQTSIPKEEIRGLRNESDLFEFLNKKGYDGIKYLDTTTHGGNNAYSYIINKEKLDFNKMDVFSVPEKDANVNNFNMDSFLKSILHKREGVFIPTLSLKEFAIHPRKLASELGGIEAKNAGDDLMAAVMDLPDEIDFHTARELRSRLISRVDEFAVINKKAPAIGKAKKLIGLLDSAIEDGLKKLDVPVAAPVAGGKAGIEPANVNIIKRELAKFDPKLSEGWDGSLWRAGKVNKDATFFALSKADAELYEGINVGEKVGQVTPNGLGKVKVLNTSNTKELMRLTGKSKREIADAGDDMFLIVEEALPKLKKEGYDSVVISFSDELSKEGSEVQVEVAILNKNLLKGGKAAASGGGGAAGGVEEASRQLGPYDAWRVANRFYKEGQEKFNNVTLRRLIKLADDTGTGAETIAPSIFKPGRVSTVRKVKSVLPPEDWRKMQSFFMEHILSKSTDTDGQIIGKRIVNNISGKPGSFGLPLMREAFTPEQVNRLQVFGRAVQLSQERGSEGAGKMVIQLTQMGALGAILTGNLELPAATVIFGPALLSRMLLHPQTAKLLTQGVTLPAKSREAAGLMARLVAASHRISKETDDEVK